MESPPPSVVNRGILFVSHKPENDKRWRPRRPILVGKKKDVGEKCGNEPRNPKH
jgi:hypothetical protein